MLANKMHILIPLQSARQKACLAKNLEPVADPYYQFVFVFGKFLQRVHYLCKPGNSAATEVIAVRKTSGENYTVKSIKFCCCMPKVRNRLFYNLFYNIVTIMITIGTGKYNNSKFHYCSTSNRYCSIIGLDNNSSHIFLTCFSASSLLFPSISSSIYFSILTPEIFLYPNERRAVSTVFP